MNKSTIYDYVRLCKHYEKHCNKCPLQLSNNGMYLDCDDLMFDSTDKANEIILNWCKEHPVETRQDRLLKYYPYIPIVGETVDICPKSFDREAIVKGRCYRNAGCVECKKNYWLAEVEENE